MMTYVEVGVAMARKAKRLVGQDAVRAKKIETMSRIFANDVAELVARNSMKIVVGSGMNERALSELKEKIDYETLTASYRDLIKDMDTVADILFARA
jgi:hypothetical protein